MDNDRPEKHSAAGWPSAEPKNPALRPRCRIMLDSAKGLGSERNADTETAAWALLACASLDGAHAARTAIARGMSPETLFVYAARADAPAALAACCEAGLDPGDVPCTITSNGRMPMAEALAQENASGCIAWLARSYPDRTAQALAAACKQPSKPCAEAALPMASPADATAALLIACSRAGYPEYLSRCDFGALAAALLANGADPKAPGPDGDDACSALARSVLKCQSDYRLRDARALQDILCAIPGWASPGAASPGPAQAIVSFPGAGKTMPKPYWANSSQSAEPVGLSLFKAALARAPELAQDTSLCDLALCHASQDGNGTALLEELLSHGGSPSRHAWLASLAQCAPSCPTDVWKARCRLPAPAACLPAANPQERALFESLKSFLESAPSSGNWTPDVACASEALSISIATAQNEAACARAPRL